MKTLLLASLFALGAPLAGATDINIAYSGTFEDKLAEEIGEREGEYLAQEVREDLQRALDKAGLSPARIDVIILDAEPNKPTFKQLGDRPGLDFARSISLGGASYQGVAYDAEGREIARIEYKWYEHDLRNVLGSSTWRDANRASERFSRKFIRTLTDAE